MTAEFDDVLAFVQSKYQEAKEGSEEIVFPIEKYAMSEGSLENRGGNVVAKASSIKDEQETRG